MSTDHQIVASRSYMKKAVVLVSIIVFCAGYTAGVITGAYLMLRFA